MRKLIIPILAILLVSCQDKEEVNNDNVQQDALTALVEYTIVNKIFQDVGNNGGDAVLSSESSTSGKSASKSELDGPSITVEPLDFTTFPKTITIDYGTGVLCQDGITRKGIVTIVSTNWYRIEDSQHTATFDNYYHENFKVEGTHVVKNLGMNQDSNLEYSVVIENGKVTAPTGAVVYYTENTTRTWIEGSDTPFNIWDDEYLLNGNQSGVSANGIEYSLTVEESLHFILLPRGIESGILDVDIADISDIKINYTNNTITIFGQIYPFSS
ncbi:hypothetical protein [Flavisericum labens]|uniref:hypothetical protein n=1 Tax=Flavisericum labens TaxID=3377112 RepID=UPI00387AEECA